MLEANFVEPAHDKQGFERTIVLQRLETKLVQIQKTYWYILVFVIHMLFSELLYIQQGLTLSGQQTVTESVMLQDGIGNFKMIEVILKKPC